ENHLKRRVVLQLAEVSYIDSAGLAALIRIFTSLRIAGGSLRLCEMSPVVLRALRVTNLHVVIPIYSSEREAVESFFMPKQPEDRAHETASTKIVCIDESSDLLAYFNAVLTAAGYDVFTARYLNDARTLIDAITPHLVICGPGGQRNESGVE